MIFYFSLTILFLILDFLNNYDLLIKNFNSYTENSSSYVEKEDYEVFGSFSIKNKFST